MSIHPDEALLAELRRRQQTPEGRVKLHERVAVEHALAHVGDWQGRRARYRGIRKNLFDLRRVPGRNAPHAHAWMGSASGAMTQASTTFAAATT